ncbi:ABC transporter ATP-binding protein [Enterovirga rhinocerotis]|uniref:Amino acid/amide ABC transporter ATP-binding protein 2 (HAAT family) n=1 Tax=Enterovirga rhinocerotis TaxID=1339210 RepID=A0A4R7C483_9HYPH|nr:ABC transporter ATP-binding protein [Enterovirga rhinocerotis]TDR93284.1 amino acid/amide ABC transporter ATP-binding protein 2 (HAAT family) [Enterovirga rhinocerotis]
MTPADGAAPLLALERFCVAYGRVEAVHEVSLNVPEGSIVTILGPNGAGKTTLLSAIMGVLPARGGATFRGAPLGRRSVEERVQDGMSLVAEKRELFVTMSVEDNLRLGGFRRRGTAAFDEALEAMWRLFPRLDERRSQLAGTLSGGERQMLATARALMSGPRLLMLDEPSLGLAPLIVKEVFRIIAELRRTGVSILLVEQNARAALEAADYAYVLENGEVVLEGPAADLRQDERVIATYLGIKSVAT